MQAYERHAFSFACLSFIAINFSLSTAQPIFCYQFKHGQKLLPQFRKIVCLVFFRSFLGEGCRPRGFFSLFIQSMMFITFILLQAYERHAFSFACLSFIAINFSLSTAQPIFCYQFKHGQKLLPQFRKIVCLVFFRSFLGEGCRPRGFFSLFIQSMMFITFILLQAYERHAFSFACLSFIAINFSLSTAQPVAQTASR